MPIEKENVLKPPDVDIRDAFFDELYAIAKEDSNVILITADMGAYSLVKFKEALPLQYINIGIAEQNMVSVAAGLALGGKKVFIYTIIPFVTYRCYEQIKIDLCCMNLPVVVVGVGPGLTYGSDGPTHHATTDIAVMRALPEIGILNPSDSSLSASCARIAYESATPIYVRIDKGKPPLLYEGKGYKSYDGLGQLRSGRRLVIISTGVMVHLALKVADALDKQGISSGVVDLYRIKPLNENSLLNIIAKAGHIVTVEENSIVGGIGSIISEFLHDHGLVIPLKRIAVRDEHCFECGNRESMHKFFRLDEENIKKDILSWISAV